jgi:Zn-dependent protease with chaperone function
LLVFFFRIAEQMNHEAFIHHKISIILETFMKIKLGLLILSITSCFNNSQKSELSHDVGKLSLGRHPSYWHNVSSSYHEKLVKNIFKRQDPKGEVNFIWQDPIIDRLQTWVDTMDAEARQTIWGKKYMAALPKPKVVILDSESPNAFVAPAFLDYQADITIPGNNGTTKDVSSIMIIDGKPNDFAVLLKIFVPFETGNQNLLGDVVDRQRLALENSGNKCLPKNIGTGKITFSGCDIPEDTDTVHGTEYLSQQTSNYITLHLGLLRFMSEESVVAIIAHELGHYYRAHATDHNKLEGGFFFYEKNTGNGKRPMPITDESINRNVRNTLDLAANRVPNAIPGTKIDNEVLMAFLKSEQNEMLSNYSDFKSSDFPEYADENGFVPHYAVLLRKCRANQPNKQNCDNFENVLKSKEISSSLKSSAMPDKKSYIALESAFLAATSNLKVGISYDRKSWSIDSEKIDLMGSFLGDRTSSPFGESISLTCWLTYREANQEVLALDQLIASCGSKLELNRKNTDHKIHELALKGIGWYTTEQEADEIGAELVASVGIEPSAMPSSLFDLFKYVHERGSKMMKGVDYNTCKKLAANNFGIGTGSIRSVAIGDWVDTHHDMCYRIYNISRDSLSHKYNVNTNKRPKFDTSWSELVTKLPAPRGNEKPRILSRQFLVE